MRLIASVGAVFLPTTLLALTLLEAPAVTRQAPRARDGVAQANTNQRHAGRLHDGVLELALVADTAQWKPADDRPSFRVAVFAEEGRAPQNPGPLIRVPAGTEVRVTLRNALARPLYVWGLVTRPAGDSTPVVVAPGATHSARFAAGEPGTYLYFARYDTLRARQTGEDSQLNGAFIVDPPGRSARDDRVFVISLIETPPDSTATDSIHRVGIWVPAINGQTWPFTERLTMTVGERATWRWINASDRGHPMHLHGFFFSVDAKGSVARDTIYPVPQRRQSVTETVWSHGTMDLTWAPDRAGNWLVHCHMIPHVLPFWLVPGEPIPEHAHDGDRDDHAQRAMAGLVMGVSVNDSERARGYVFQQPGALERHLRLIAQEGRFPSGKRAVSYILQRGAEPAPDSVLVPGAPIVLRKDEPVAITVVNRMHEPTSVHWHGLELDSYYDGVAGWSGNRIARAPLIAPGDSFTVHLVPPRAGTYIYHSHVDEREQLVNGAYGALVVLEPYERWNPETDRAFMISEQRTGEEFEFLLDGVHAPDTLRLDVGKTYRFRLVSIGFAPFQQVSLRRDSVTVEQWTPIAKDGADLAPVNRRRAPARVVLGIGETYDFAYTPTSAGRLTMDVAQLITRDKPWVRRVVLVQ